jgi:hypothetical protein
VDPLEYGHIHLSGAGWDCYSLDTGGMGVPQGNNCVVPNDYTQAPRSLMSHDTGHCIEIWQADAGFNEGADSCVFDFGLMRILGSTAVQVEIVKENLTYVWSGLEPGHWNFSAWGDDALYIRLESADGETEVIEIDDILARG